MAATVIGFLDTFFKIHPDILSESPSRTVLGADRRKSAAYAEAQRQRRTEDENPKAAAPVRRQTASKTKDRTNTVSDELLSAKDADNTDSDQINGMQTVTGTDEKAPLRWSGSVETPVEETCTGRRYAAGETRLMQTATRQCPMQLIVR